MLHFSKQKVKREHLMITISCFAIFGGHVDFFPVNIILFYKYYYIQRNCLPNADKKVW